MIYIDLLILIDTFMNYIILLTTSIILNRLTTLKKILLASLIGNISLSLLFININIIIFLCTNTAISIIMSIIAFKYKDIIYTFKNVLYMHIISIFIAGGIYLINIHFLSNVNDNVPKIISLLIISPIITYIYIQSTNKIKINKSNYYKIDIYLKDKPKISLTSYLDTGNKLIDPYTHNPIILVSKKVLPYIPDKTILVPYNTIDNEGLISCFKPEKIYIDSVGFNKKVLIALVDNISIEGADCLLNAKLLERILKYD